MVRYSVVCIFFQQYLAVLDIYSVSVAWRRNEDWYSILLSMVFSRCFIVAIRLGLFSVVLPELSAFYKTFDAALQTTYQSAFQAAPSSSESAAVLSSVQSTELQTIFPTDTQS